MDLNCRNITNKNKNNDRNLFIKNLSLEIVNTLNGLDGFLKLVNEKELSERNFELISQAKYATFLLSHQLNSLNYIQKEELLAPQINYQPLNLSNMLNNSLNFFKNKYSEKNIIFEFYHDNNIPVELFGDSIKLNEIFNSLIENAFLFAKDKITLNLFNTFLSEDTKIIKFELSFGKECPITNKENESDNIGLKSKIKKFDINLALSTELLNQLESQLILNNDENNFVKITFDLIFYRQI